MQINPEILQESPDLAKLQKSFQDVNAQNAVPTPPESPVTPIPANEDPLTALIKKTSGKGGTPSFTGSVASLPSATRYPFVLPQTNYEELYAQGQSTGNKWLNALVKMGGIAGTTFIQGTLGTINGVIKASQDGKLSSFYDNEFSRGLDNFNTSMEDRFPNYYTEAEKNADWYSPTNLLTANFWGDKVVKNLGYAAGAIGSGVAWTKALQAARLFSTASSLGKMTQAAEALESGISTVPQLEKLNAGRSILEATARNISGQAATLDKTQRLITAGLAATSEASLEALQGLNAFRTARINEYVEKYGTRPTGAELNDINAQSEAVGNVTLGMNMALLLASNYVQFPKIIGGGYAAEKALYNNGIKETEDIVFNQTTNQFIKRVPQTRLGRFTKGVKNISNYFFSPTEAYEEGAQFAIGVGTEDYFNKKYRGEQVDFFSSLGEGVKETLTSKEGIESILIGGFSGAISTAYGRRSEQRQLNLNTQEAVTAFNQGTFTGYLKDNIESFNRSMTLQEQRAQAIKDSNELDANDLETDYLHNYMQPRIKYGRFDLVQEDINKYKQLAATAQGFQQLIDEGIVAEDATPQQFLERLQQTENYATAMRDLYKSLNLRYSGQLNKDKSRIYPDEVIDKMVYASSKVNAYDRMLPNLTNPLLLAGINVQPLLDSLAVSGRPAESLVQDTLNQISNLDVLSDVKEELKSNLRDALEVTMRRKQFMRDYDRLKKSPKSFIDNKYGITDPDQPTTYRIPQVEGTVDLEEAASYGLNENFTREGNRLTLFPNISIVGRNALGEIEVRFPNGQTAFVQPADLSDFNISTTSNANQEELERRYLSKIQDISNREEFTELNIPTDTLENAISFINELDNAALTDLVEQSFREAEQEFATEAEELAELRANKEKLAELDKEFEEAEEASADEPTGIASEDNKVIKRVNPYDSMRKSLDILFDSTTSPNYEETSENDNFHRRTNKFLNNINDFPDRDDVEVLLVTRTNQDALGLSGLIPETIEGSSTSSLDPDEGIIRAVFVKGDSFIDVNGNPISAIGETPDLNKLIYQTLPSDSLQWSNGENRYVDTQDNPSKGATEEEAEEAQSDWRNRRATILRTPTGLRYKFDISRGIPNVAPGSVPSSPVGIILTEEDLNNKVIVVPITEARKSGNVRLGKIRHNGEDLFFPLGRPLVNKGSVLYQLNNKKFNEEEADLLQTIISNLPQEDGVNEDILNYLSNVLYIATPKEGRNPSPNQMWFENGYLYLGDTETRVPFVKETLLSSPELAGFLDNASFNVNTKTLYKAPREFKEIINENLETRSWPSYQHFLVSTEGGRTDTPLNVTLVNPATSEDPNTSPFLQKYVILKDFEIPAIEGEELTPLEISEDAIVDDAADTLQDEGDAFFQLPQEGDTPGVNEENLLKLEIFLDTAGIDKQIVDRIVVNGVPVPATGLTDPLNKLIQVVQGKENIALPEEAMHIAVDIIEQQDPTLFNKMLNKIGSYNIYRETYEQYKTNPFYQKNGKPDIRKLKKEAIAKQLVQTVIDQQDQQSLSWWQQILNFLSSIFTTNPFEQSVDLVLQNQLTSSPIPSTDGVYLQIEENAGTTFERIVSINKDFATGNITPKITVESIVETLYDDFYRTKNIDEATHKTLIAQEKTNKTDEGHQELSRVLSRLIDEDGFVREKVTDVSDTPSQLHENLFKNIKARLKTYPSGTKFVFDATVYDAAQSKAGKVDLLAIEPDGTVNILDFRFLELNEDERISTQQRQAFKKTVDEYENILTSSISGIQIGQKRTIPVITQGDSILIGNPNVNKETDPRLQPILSATEKTGNEQLDEYITRLNALINDQQKVGVERGEEYVKFKETGNLIAAVRELQLKQSGDRLIKTGNAHIKRMNLYFKKYLDQLNKGQTEELATENLSGEIIRAVKVARLYQDLISIYNDTFSTKESSEQRRAKILQASAKSLEDKLINLGSKIRTDVIAIGVGLQDSLRPEKEISLYDGRIRSLSGSPTKAGQILWRLVNGMNNKKAIEFNEEFSKLEKIDEDFTKFAKSKGTTAEKLFTTMLEHDSKGRWTGKLVNKTAHSYYIELEKAVARKDTTWVLENIDKDAYKARYEKELKEREDNLKAARYKEDDAENTALKEKWLQDFREKYDIFNYPEAVNKDNWWLKNYALQDKWKSEAYKNIEKDAPVLRFYNYYQERNRVAEELGMIKAWEADTFVPNVRKTWVEGLSFGMEGSNRVINKTLANGVRISVDDEAFGRVDPLTGENKDELFAMYVYDIGTKTIDKDGEVYFDYSEKSQDLFKTMALMNEQIIKYKYASEIENTVQLLHLTEVNKDAIKRSRTGGILEKIKGTNKPQIIPNLENSKYLKGHIDYYLYGRTLEEGRDVTFTFKYGAVSKAVNKIFGNVMPDSPDETITVSGRKALQVLNRYFATKVLAFNLPSAASSLVGGKANAYIAAGRFFTKTDLSKAEVRAFSAKFWTPEGKKYAALVDAFATILGETAHEKARKLSTSNMVKYLSSEGLMTLQRESDKLIQLPVSIATFDNTMVENGELVNIREYVKKQNNYDSKYDAGTTAESRAALDKKIEREVEALKNERSLPKIVQIVNDRAVIPGVDLYSKSSLELRNQIQQYTKNIIGNMSPEDLSLYRRSVMMQSFMMFKNWIPRMAEVRFNNFRFNAGTDAYEWGRMRMLANAVRLNVSRGALDVLALLGGTKTGNFINIAKQAYHDKKKAIEAEGETFKMSMADFIDSYARGIQGSLMELGMWVTLAGILLSLKQLDLDDEDPNVKGLYKWSVRFIDRASDELGFFYNPMSYINLANGNVFPAIGVVKDIYNLFSSGLSEGFYMMTGDEEGMKKTKTAKYMFKAFPLSKEALTYMAIFNDDIAREWGVKVPLEVGNNR